MNDEPPMPRERDRTSLSVTMSESISLSMHVWHTPTSFKYARSSSDTRDGDARRRLHEVRLVQFRFFAYPYLHTLSVVYRPMTTRQYHLSLDSQPVPDNIVVTQLHLPHSPSSSFENPEYFNLVHVLLQRPS